MDRYYSRAERLAALETATNILQARQPCTQAQCRIWVEPNWLDALAEWRWPGVVRVTLRYTGALVAQSKPGKPRELDLRAIRS